MALGNIHLHFAWQAWHLATSTFIWRGRRRAFGTGLALVARLGRLVAGDAVVLCVADVALAALGWLWWCA